MMDKGIQIRQARPLTFKYKYEKTNAAQYITKIAGENIRSLAALR